MTTRSLHPDQMLIQSYLLLVVRVAGLRDIAPTPGRTSFTCQRANSDACCEMATESENESRYTESHGASYIPRRGNPNRMALTVMYTLCHDIRRFLPDSSSRRILNVVVEIKCGRDSVADVDWYELDVPFELDGILYNLFNKLI